MYGVKRKRKPYCILVYSKTINNARTTETKTFVGTVVVFVFTGPYEFHTQITQRIKRKGKKRGKVGSSRKVVHRTRTIED